MFQASEEPSRDQWSNPIEFLLSCIAMSVGLGNVWRFPFVALENGGGAFLIPYILVLLLIGKPLYYMELCLGQFASAGSVRVWDLAPAFRGESAARSLRGGVSWASFGIRDRSPDLFLYVLRYLTMLSFLYCCSFVYILMLSDK